MLQVLNRQGITANLSQLKQMMNVVRNAGNPQVMLQSMMSNNPQYKQIMDIVNQNGGDAKKAFYSMAEQRGVDPNEILSMLQ